MTLKRLKELSSLYNDDINKINIIKKLKNIIIIIYNY